MRTPFHALAQAQGQLQGHWAPPPPLQSKDEPAPAREPAPAPAPARAPREPAMLKYIITRDPFGREHPILFPRDLQHNTMLPAGHTPASAGFLCLYGPTLIIPAIDSTTLRVGPRPQDRDLLTKFLGL